MEQKHEDQELRRLLKLFEDLFDEWKGNGNDQKVLAEAIDMTPPGINHYFQKRNRWFTPLHERKLCEVLEIPKEYFALAETLLSPSQNREMVGYVLQAKTEYLKNLNR